MSKPKKQIAIDLKTVIRDGPDKEESQVKASGLFFQKGNLDVLTFQEKMEDVEISTLVTIQADKVTIKRSGAVSMHQQFRLGQKTENVYKHPHGNIHMETHLNHFTYIKLEPGKSAQLKLEYTVKLNGQDERNHILELVFKEEDAQ